MYARFTKDSEGLWGKKNTGQRITEGQVKTGEKVMIRTTRALIGEKEKREDIPGTAGPPEIARDPVVTSRTTLSISVVGPVRYATD